MRVDTCYILANSSDYKRELFGCCFIFRVPKMFSVVVNVLSSERNCSDIGFTATRNNQHIGTVFASYTLYTVGQTDREREGYSCESSAQISVWEDICICTMILRRVMLWISIDIASGQNKNRTGCFSGFSLQLVIRRVKFSGGPDKKQLRVPRRRRGRRRRSTRTFDLWQ